MQLYKTKLGLCLKYKLGQNLIINTQKKIKTLYYQNSKTYYRPNIGNLRLEFGSSSMYQKLEKGLVF